MNQELLNAYLEENEQTQEEDSDNEEQVVVSNVNLKEKNEKDSSFNGDIKQFYEYLTDRVGAKKLAKVRELIKKYANSTSSKDEEVFKNELESLLDEKQRAT